MAEVILGLGSNLGMRKLFLEHAITRLDAHPEIRWVASSEVYETSPKDMDGPTGNFLNMVAIFSTLQSPSDFLGICRTIEHELGRPGERPKGQPRTIDLDLIAYDRKIVRTEGLTIPHPRYQERRFVLVPLAEVRPKFADPESGKDIQSLLDDCKDTTEVRRWDEAESPG